MSKKKEIDANKIDRLAEKIIEARFIELYAAKISFKDGTTYISYSSYDCMIELMIKRLEMLFNLMGIEYGMSWKNGVHFVISGEDVARANYIRKFIDNGYKLKWE